MKILWLSHLVPYPPKAGVLLRAHYLVKELAKHHEVHLLAFNQKTLITPYFEDYETGTNIALEKMKESCPRVQFFDCPVDRTPHRKKLCALTSLLSGTAYNINWLRDADYANTVKQWHAVEQYDLIHCDTLSLVPYVKDLNNTKLSLDHHNVESHMLLRRAGLEKNIIKKFYFWQEGLKVARIEKEACPKFDTNLTCSELDAIRFKELCPEALFTEIPNGVDIDMFTPAKGEQEPHTFIFIGTLDWYPNTRAVRFLAYELWPVLKSTFPNAKINVIGSGAPSDLLNFGNKEPDFNMLGYVDNLTPYLDSAFAYLCPIDDGGGTKLKLLDAFSSGKAVVAHEVACEGLKVTDGEQCLLANNVEEYIKQITKLNDDEQYRKALESRARKHVEQHFAFSSIGKNLADHFSKIVS